MSLLGWLLPVALSAVALVLFVLVVVGRPRPARPGPALVARIGEVLALNVVVVLIAASILNDQYVFYSSWSDLFGTTAPPGTQVAGGTAHAAALKTPLGVGLADLRTPAVLPALPSPGAQVQTYHLTGPMSGVSGTVIVVLPPGYNPASPKLYPVIETFHGYPGIPLSAMHGLNLPSSIDAAYRQHLVAPSILVLPQTDNPNRLDTECMNGPGGSGPQVETWLARDIPTWVVHHFRVARDRSSWATMGYSLGGWCSAMIGMRHPDIFGASIVFMGYFRPEFAKSYNPVLPGSPDWVSHDLTAMASSAPPPIAMWVMTAKDDKHAYPATEAFLAAAKPPLSVTAYILASGGHRVGEIPPLIPRVMSWLSSSLPGFHA